VTTGWGCTNAPPVCEVTATSLQASRQVVRDRSTINRGDSGGPLLVRGRCGAGLRQVGVTSLGADSTTRLYAGFTSIPVEAGWIAAAVAPLRAA
jgi:secreted trypsin-like serine protease